MDGRNILILGGTGDAIFIAEQLSVASNLNIITSLAGATRNPRFPTGKTRIGGFGGKEGLIGFLENQEISLIVDATHPFSSQIKENAIFAANKLRLPLLHLVRDEWQVEFGDRWYMVDNLQDASEKLRELSKTRKKNVFLTIGRKDLTYFSNIKNCNFLIRSIEKPNNLESFCCVKWIEGRGPFSSESEIKLLTQEQVDIIVTKNSGGLSGRSKLLAARTLGLPAIVVKQPPRPPGEQYNTVENIVEVALKRVGLAGTQS